MSETRRSMGAILCPSAHVAQCSRISQRGVPFGFAFPRPSPYFLPKDPNGMVTVSAASEGGRLSSLTQTTPPNHGGCILRPPPSGFLKQWIVLNMTYTMFFPYTYIPFHLKGSMLWLPFGMSELLASLLLHVGAIMK